MAIFDNPTRNQYTATAGQAVFAYTFEAFLSSDITVEINGSVTTNYTVSGVGNDNGGNITLNSAATAGDIVTIYRDMQFSRLTDYQQSGDFLAEEVNNDFDRIWAALQQTDSTSRLGIRPTIDDAILNTSNTELADPLTRANKALGFTSEGELDYFSQVASVVGSLRVYSTLAAAVSDIANITIGDVIIVGERSAGNGGGAIWDAVDATAVTENEGNIVTGNATISFSLRIGKVANALEFGAVDNFENALNAMNASGVKRWLIPESAYTQTSTITITQTDVEIECKGTITNNGIVVFLSDGPTRLKLVGGEYRATNYQTDRPAVIDSRNGKNVLELHIEGCETFNMCLADIEVETGISTVNIDKNRIVSDDNTDTYYANTPLTSPTELLNWLNVLSTGTVTDTRQPCHVNITNNHFDVFHQTGSNVDVCKVTGDMRNPKVIGNTFRNRNVNSQAEFDFFGGGRFAKVVGNDFRNVGIKFQTHNLTGVTRSEYSIISENTWDFDSGTVQQIAVLLRSSWLTFNNNILRYVEADRPASRGNFTGVAFNALNGNNNGFGSNLPAFNTVTGNTIDLFGAGSTSGTVQIRTMDPSNLVASILSSNNLVGGIMPSPNEGLALSGNNFYSVVPTDGQLNSGKRRFGESNSVLANTYDNASGTLTNRFPRILVYDGNPNTNITASPGDICMDTSGGAGSTLYVKESGVNTTSGWIAK